MKQEFEKKRNKNSSWVISQYAVASMPLASVTAIWTEIKEGNFLYFGESGQYIVHVVLFSLPTNAIILFLDLVQMINYSPSYDPGPVFWREGPHHLKEQTL